MSTTCFTPKGIINKDTQASLLVPCGKCYNCLTRRQKEIVFRFEQALYKAPIINGFQAAFITFTYSPENLPISKYSKYPTIRKKDMQKCRMRYRKLCEIKYGRNLFPPLKFLECGEYGSQYNRPHYHMLVINADLELLEKSWSIRNKPLGIVDIQTKFETNAIGYTCKYLTKLDNEQQNYKRIEPEYVSWSRSLGIEFLTPQMKNWYMSDTQNRTYIPMKDNRKMQLPRYYKNKLEFSEYDLYLQQKKSSEFREIATLKFIQENNHISNDVREIMRYRDLNRIERNKQKISRKLGKQKAFPEKF